MRLGVCLCKIRREQVIVCLVSLCFLGILCNQNRSAEFCDSLILQYAFEQLVAVALRNIVGDVYLIGDVLFPVCQV